MTLVQKQIGIDYSEEAIRAAVAEHNEMARSTMTTWSETTACDPLTSTYKKDLASKAGSFSVLLLFK